MNTRNVLTALWLYLCLYGCNTHEELVIPHTTEPAPITSERIDPLQEAGLMDKLNEGLFRTTQSNGRIMQSMAGDIDLSKAHKVVDSRKGIVRYTFLLKNKGEPVTRNLVLRQAADGHFSLYTITYHWDTDWVLANPERSASLRYFTGMASFQTLDQHEFYRLHMEEGKGNLYKPLLPVDANGRVQCTGGDTGSDPDGSGGSGGTGAPADDGWEGTGTGDFGEYPPPPDGGGGGGGEVIVIFLDPVEDEEADRKDEYAVRMACETPEYPDQQVCEGDDALTTSCESEPIGSEEDPRSPYEIMADRWEEEICLQENFAANDCLMEIWQLMNEHNVGYETLSRFTGELPQASLCIDLQPLEKAVNGHTEPYLNSDSVRIVINSNLIERSKLDHARTLLHEMIHAELFSMVIEAGGYAGLKEYAAQHQEEDEFTVLWNYIDTYGYFAPDSNAGYQHEYMADYYIEYISQGLKKLYPYLSSSEFQNHINSLDQYSGEPFSLDKFLYFYSWTGLTETESFQKNIVEKGKLQIYSDVFYLGMMEVSSQDCSL